MTSGSPTDRRPAIWPWLLLPLVALALFFALRSFRQALPALPAEPEVTESVAPGPEVP